MKNSSVDFVGVEDNSNLIGVVSYKDLQIASNLSGNENSEVFEVTELTNEGVDEETSIEQAIVVMQSKRSHYILIKNNFDIIGILTCFDLLRAINANKSANKVVKPA